MDFDIVKKLIDNKKINRENYNEVLKFFLMNNSEKFLDYFISFSRFITLFYSTQVYNFFVTIISKFKKNLEQTTNNLKRIYYCEARFYLVINDRIRCMELSFKLLELNNLDKLYKYHAHTFIVNCLFGEKLYREALNENNLIINSDLYKSIPDFKKLIVILNSATINVYNKNFKAAVYFDTYAKRFINKNSLGERALKLYNLIHSLVILYIGNVFFSSEEIRLCTNKYFADAKSDDFVESIYNNFSVHNEILDILLKSGRKYEVRQLCFKCFKMTSKELIEADLFKIYLKCLDKNDDEYNETLLNYINALEKVFQSRSKNLKTFYTSYHNYNTINFELTKLENDYNHDPLTKCFSRAKFEKIKFIKNFGSIIYFDINNFKQFNDTYGHARGDEFLTKFVENIFKVMPFDHLYRLGGDEFVLISKDNDELKIKKKILSLDNIPLFDTKCRNKFSAGVIINKKNYTVIDATNKADKLLYESKRSDNEFYKFYKEV